MVPCGGQRATWDQSSLSMLLETGSLISIAVPGYLAYKLPRGLLVSASHGTNTRVTDMYMLPFQALRGLRGFELRFSSLHSKQFINGDISLRTSFEFLSNYCSMSNNDFPETDGIHYKLMN